MPDADPDFTPRCLKCGSDAVVPDVRLIDTYESGRKAAEVGIATKPDAWVLKGEARVETRAVVCGDCGFIELYAADPHAIWTAHVDRAARDLGSG